MEAEIRTLSSEVREKSTYDMIECERRINFNTGRLTEVRLDTGEIINDRRLTSAEAQRQFP
jgi:hypothetical protein